MFDYSSEYIVKSFGVSDTKNGKKRGTLLLENNETKSTLSCVLWEEAINNNDPRVFRKGNTVKIVSADDYNEQWNNLPVKKLELLQEAPIGLDNNYREKLFNNILEVIDGFEDKKLKEAMSKMILENAELFKITPAAKSMHHNYVGGLMQHIWECIEFAQIVLPKLAKGIWYICCRSWINITKLCQGRCSGIL